MNLILLIVLILLVIGALPTWPYSTGWGYYPSGGLGLVLLIPPNPAFARTDIATAQKGSAQPQETCDRLRSRAIRGRARTSAARTARCLPNPDRRVCRADGALG